MKSKLFLLILFTNLAGNIFAQPSNNECLNAIFLNTNTTCIYTSGTTTGATQSAASTTCGGNADDDVWFQFGYTANTTVTISVIGSANFDAVIELSVNCSQPSYIACSNTSGVGGSEALVYSSFNSSGFYNIRVYHAGLYSGSGTFEIAVTTASVPTATAGSNSPVCEGTSLNLIGGGGNSYVWTGPNNFASSSPNPVINNVTPAAAGTYFVTATANGGCKSNAITSVIVKPAPNAPSNPTSNSPQCADVGVTLTKSGNAPTGETWYWQGTTCDTSKISSGNTYPATTSGTYNIRSRNNTNQCWSVNCGTVAVIVNPNPAAPTGGGNTIACTNTVPATLTAIPPSGSITDWYNVSNGGSSIMSNSNTYSTSIAGNYYAESRNTTTGCKSISRTLFTLTVNPVVTPSVSISANPTGAVCAGTNVNFTAIPANGGTSSFQWKLNNNTVGNNATYSNSTLVNGDQVTCVLTSTAICASPASATSNTITMTINSINVSANTMDAACGQANGSASATATGSTPPYTYHWSNGQNTQTATGLAANTYTVTVTGSTGCIAATTALVSNPNAPVLITSSTPQTTTTCNGTATVTVSGGISPYTYLWSSNANNQTTDTAISLCGNITYSVTVKDSINCLTIDTITVNKTVGVSEKTESTAFVVYPNPNKGMFTLSYEVFDTEDLQIQVLNIVGNIIYSKEYKKVNGKFSKEINLSNVANGIYSVEIKANKKIVRQKLIKE